MSRRWPAGLVALLALVALASIGRCKPPDLPKYQNVTVTPRQVIEVLSEPSLLQVYGLMNNYPIQVLSIEDFVDPYAPCGEEICEVPVPEAARRVPGVEPVAEKPSSTPETVAVKKNLFEEVGNQREIGRVLAKARKLARMGLHEEALKYLDQARVALADGCSKDLCKEIEADSAHVRWLIEQHKQAVQAATTRKKQLLEATTPATKKPTRPHSDLQSKLEAGVGPVKVICQGGASEANQGCVYPNGEYVIAVEPHAGGSLMVPGVEWPRKRGPFVLCVPCEAKACCPVAASFHEVPLVSALDKLRGATGCKVCIDCEGLRKAGVVPTKPVSVEVRGLPLHCVLELMLRSHRLQATVVGDEIEVTCTAECRIPAMKPSKSTPASVCPKCDLLHDKAVKALQAREEAAKKVLFAGLMKACRLAINDGRYEKAAELAHEAHAIDPDAVESDPMVIRLDLLHQYRPATRYRSLTGAAGKPAAAAGAEESSEVPGAESKLVPHVPGVFGDVVEGVSKPNAARINRLPIRKR